MTREEQASNEADKYVRAFAKLIPGDLDFGEAKKCYLAGWNAADANAIDGLQIIEIIQDRARAFNIVKELQIKVDFLKGEIIGLTHHGRQGELEQANVQLADENRKLREALCTLVEKLK